MTRTPPAPDVSREASRDAGATRQALASADFITCWMAVKDVAGQVRAKPGRTAPETVTALAEVLREARHAEQAHARILYTEAAGALARLLAPDAHPAAARAAHAELARLLCAAPTPSSSARASGSPRMAAAAALGDLPLDIRGRDIELPDPLPLDEIPAASLVALVKTCRVGPAALPSAGGRSLLVPLADGSLLVLKRLRAGEDPAGLAREAAWLSRLAMDPLPVRCEIPRPVQGGPVPGLVRLRVAPPCPGQDISPCATTLAYRCSADYFRYPNEPGALPEPEAFLELMGRAAFLFGHLAGQGILHEAPIPLFHNRTQAFRRDDAGRYEWRRMGRLDRWLASCRHPNWGASGLRDFEHLVPVSKHTDLHRALGDLLLSLALVAGSYFRARDPERVGRTLDAPPTDARDLFDQDLLARTLAAMATQLHLGFAGLPAPGSITQETTPLAARMVQEMGVDANMLEVLRAPDQTRMGREAVREHLVAHGWPKAKAASIPLGRSDIRLASGPHLGNFNGQITLPELVEWISSASALAIASRYRQAPGRSR